MEGDRSNDDAHPNGRHGAGMNGNGRARGGSRVQAADHDRLPSVLVPGWHPGSPHANGLPCEVGYHKFAADVLEKLPKHLLYRAVDGAIGQIAGQPGVRQFAPVTPEAGMRLVDQHVRLIRCERAEHGNTIDKFRPCSRQLGAVVLDAAKSSPLVRDLKLVVRHPGYGPGFKLLHPGWNDCGIWYEQPSDLRSLAPILDVDRIRATLEDLVVDFPWRAEDGDGGRASRENFFGLMLTVLLRPALAGNVPLHLIDAPGERTGKSKLAADVIGGIFMGGGIGNTPFPEDEAEMAKLLISFLLKPKTLINFDNVVGKMRSGYLASFLTSGIFEARRLGANQIESAPNQAVVMATGNNVELSVELAKRTIPCRLRSRVTNPEERDDFKYPDLEAHVKSSRLSVLRCLIGAVELWKSAGQPAGAWRLGGFEAWARTLGGIMSLLGFEQWAQNVNRWIKGADLHTDDLRHFVAAWGEKFGAQGATAGELVELAESIGAFKEECDPKGQGKISLASFQRRVLKRHQGAVVGPSLVLSRRASGRNSVYVLAALDDVESVTQVDSEQDVTTVSFPDDDDPTEGMFS